MMFFFLSLALSVDLVANEAFDLLTWEEKACTTMRSGMVRFTNDKNQLEICSNRKWHPYYPHNCYDNRVHGLIGHWKMDEQDGNEVADDSGNENHGVASGPVAKLSKFSRGRYFNADGIITVSNAPILNFGVASFSVSGWLNIVDVTYPMTTFAVKKGYGCYFGEGREGWLPGWELGHGYQATGLRVCIRDKEDRMVNKVLVFDDGYQPAELIGQWVHYVIVYDREHHKKVFAYVNGIKQSNKIDISSVKGSIDNGNALEIGLLYGWKTKGILDEYRVYNRALDAHEADAIFHQHFV